LLPQLKLDEEKVPPKTLEKLVINMNDFQNAIKEITPSAMREVYLEPPDVKWDDIGGLDAVKRELQEAVEWPM
jgi:transitional endoplasmic reticulum ATPase